MNIDARTQVLACLRELADLEFQERVWVRGDGPEVSSYDELLSQLFDDTTLGDLLETGRARTEFGDEAERELLKLSELLDKVPLGLDAVARIRHPLWNSVVETAGRAAELIASQKQMPE